MQGKFTKPAVVSPDGVYIAIISESQLFIRYTRPATETDTLIRIIQLTPDLARNASIIKFSQRTKTSSTSPKPFDEQSVRILVSDLKNIHVWDLLDSTWHAHIENTFEGTQSLASVDFGFFDNHVLAFFPFSSKLAIYDLSSGRTLEIKDPKSPAPKGHSFRPTSGNLALLARCGAPGSAPVDVVLLLNAETLDVVTTVQVPGVDAQGVRWSRDGSFFAVWDTASNGMKVFIYFADGSLYRSYSGIPGHTDEELGLKSLDWSPANNYLAVGGFDDNVVLLGTKTFSPVIQLLHDPRIQHDRIPVWQEHLSLESVANFERALQPILPPSLSVQAGQKTGVPFISFNTDGTLLASRHDAVPNTIWIWSPHKMMPEAVLVCRLPIQQCVWHPKDKDKLLMTCASKEPVAYIWQRDQRPWATPIPLDSGALKYEAKWLPNKEGDEFTMFVGSPSAFVIGKLMTLGEGYGSFQILP